MLELIYQDDRRFLGRFSLGPDNQQSRRTKPKLLSAIPSSYAATGFLAGPGVSNFDHSAAALLQVQGALAAILSPGFRGR